MYPWVVWLAKNESSFTNRLKLLPVKFRFTSTVAFTTGNPSISISNLTWFSLTPSMVSFAGDGYSFKSPRLAVISTRVSLPVNLAFPRYHIKVLFTPSPMYSFDML